MPQRKIALRGLAWGLTAAMLLISMWRWLSLADHETPSVQLARSSNAARALAPVTLPEQAAFEDYRFALERPVFHPSRRPFPDRKTLVALEAAAKSKQPAPKPSAPPPPPPSPPQNVQLRGTVLAGSLQSAVFERTGSQNYIRLIEGGQLDGWTLVKIGQEEVVLRLGEQSVTLPLAKPNDGRRNEVRQRPP
jgi:hypothetical protein